MNWCNQPESVCVCVCVCAFDCKLALHCFSVGVQHRLDIKKGLSWILLQNQCDIKQ